MSAPNWNDLLPNYAAISALASEDLERAGSAANQYSQNISFGIAAIGNLLACAALNEEQGLCSDSVADLGWLLQSLGELNAKLVDTEAATREQRRRIKRNVA